METKNNYTIELSEMLLIIVYIELIVIFILVHYYQEENKNISVNISYFLLASAVLFTIYSYYKLTTYTKKSLKIYLATSVLIFITFCTLITLHASQSVLDFSTIHNHSLSIFAIIVALEAC